MFHNSWILGLKEGMEWGTCNDFPHQFLVICLLKNIVKNGYILHIGIVLLFEYTN